MRDSDSLVVVSYCILNRIDERETNQLASNPGDQNSRQESKRLSGFSECTFEQT